MAPAVTAMALHHAKPLAPSIRFQPKPAARRLDWGAWLWSFVLALGFTSTFLLPTLRHSTTSPTTSGTVLGEDVIVPLEVTVTTNLPAGSSSVRVQPKTGTIPEALARAAAKAKTSFDYTSRGSGIYLNSFAGLTNGQGGRWLVQLNGQALGDLAGTILSQGDELVLTWQPQ